MIGLASCRDLSFQGSIDYNVTGFEPAPVLVSVGAVDNPNSKSNGVIDTDEFWKWKDTQIYVYAFRKNAGGFNAFSAESQADCLVDGSKDGGRNHGKIALVGGETGFAEWQAGGDELYYPEGSTPYDFYAYYIDDSKVDDASVSRNAESITMPLTINGAQDIMSAKAVLTEKQIADSKMPEAEAANLPNVSFSAYTANYGIHPELYFTHHLVRLSFEAYPGRPEADRVCIQSIVVESKDEAVFTVAHKDPSKMGLDFSADQTPVWMDLYDKDYKTPLKDNVYKLNWIDAEADKSVYDRTALPVGGSLLVAPDKSYKCTINISETISGEVTDDIIYDFEINSAEGGFAAGNHYVVRLCINGRYDVVVEPDVIVTEWIDGGDYEIEVK